MPTRCLDAAGRDYTIAFKSSSFTSLQAAIRAGFAVGVLPASSLGNGIARLTSKDGFPDLPISRHTILVSASAPRDLTNAMAAAIRSARPEWMV